MVSKNLGNWDQFLKTGKFEEKDSGKQGKHIGKLL